MNDITRMDNFGTLAVLNKSEIDQQIATAKRYPRNITEFKQRSLELATLDEATAQECIYALPRDGKTIVGPSVRLAEIVLHAWGNARAGARVIDEGAEFVVAQGIFHDLEANVVVTKEFQRRITNRNGQRYSADMVATTGNACCSIALRNAIFAGIPKALWASVEAEAKRIIAGDVKTLANRRAEMVKAFVIFGVDLQRILQKLELPGIEDIGLPEMVVLRALYQSIKDEEMSPEAAFPLVPPVGAKPTPAPAKATNLDQFAAKGEKIDPETGEVTTATGEGELLDSTGQPYPPPIQEAAAKRKRRTKAEMEAARAAEAPHEVVQTSGTLVGVAGEELDQGDAVVLDEDGTLHKAQGSPPAASNDFPGDQPSQPAQSNVAPQQPAGEPYKATTAEMTGAFKEGREARKLGRPYKAVPGEYRSDKRASAWQQGWQDGDRAFHATGEIK